jgi:hypothetical protein
MSLAITEFKSARYRCIRRAAWEVPFNFWDAAVGPPKLNGAGAPAGLATTIARDEDAVFSALTAAGASSATQEIGVLSILAADTDFQSAVFRISGTNILSPMAIRVETEPCEDSGVYDPGSSTVNTVRLRAGASATDDAYRFMLYEHVRDGGEPLVVGEKRLIWKYDGTNKDVYFVTPLPAVPVDNSGAYKITRISMGEAKAQLLHEAMIKAARITGGVSTTGATAAGLAGAGTNALVNSAAMVVSGDANNGLIRQNTGYVTGTGACVFGALPAAPSVDDLLVILGSFGAP